MALINCPDCNRQVSDRAAACPDCGGPIAGTAGRPAGASGPLTGGQQAIVIANQKYALPAILQFFIPVPGVGQAIKGQGKKAAEFFWRTVAVNILCWVLAYFIEPFRGTLIVISVISWLINWGQATFDAYNSHDDDVTKIALPGSAEGEGLMTVDAKTDKKA